MVLTASCFGGKFQITEIRPILSFKIPNVKLFYEGLLFEAASLNCNKILSSYTLTLPVKKYSNKVHFTN